MLHDCGLLFFYVASDKMIVIYSYLHVLQLLKLLRSKCGSNVKNYITLYNTIQDYINDYKVVLEGFFL